MYAVVFNVTESFSEHPVYGNFEMFSVLILAFYFDLLCPNQRAYVKVIYFL